MRSSGHLGGSLASPKAHAGLCFRQTLGALFVHPGATATSVGNLGERSGDDLGCLSLAQPQHPEQLVGDQVGELGVIGVAVFEQGLAEVDRCPTDDEEGDPSIADREPSAAHTLLEVTQHPRGHAVLAVGDCGTVARQDSAQLILDRIGELSLGWCARRRSWAALLRYIGLVAKEES